MRDVFNKHFSLDDEGTPRTWRPQENIPVLARAARREAARVLALLVSCDWVVGVLGLCGTGVLGVRTAQAGIAQQAPQRIHPHMLCCALPSFVACACCGAGCHARPGLCRW